MVKMQQKMKIRGMKWLHFLHILSASVWLGAVVCVGYLAIVCFSYESQSDFITFASLIVNIYSMVVKPICLFILLQGIFYGFFTNWGFIKHKWVLFKWILWPFLMALTSGFTVKGLETIIDKVNKTGLIPDGKNMILYILLQFCILIIKFFVSVFKPFEKKKQLDARNVSSRK